MGSFITYSLQPLMVAFFSAVVQIGKWGLTSNCVTAISDALEANELIKVFILAHLPPTVN